MFSFEGGANHLGEVQGEETSGGSGLAGGHWCSLPYCEYSKCMVSIDNWFEIWSVINNLENGNCIADNIAKHQWGCSGSDGQQEPIHQTTGFTVPRQKLSSLYPEHVAKKRSEALLCSVPQGTVPHQSTHWNTFWNMSVLVSLGLEIGCPNKLSIFSLCSKWMILLRRLEMLLLRLWGRPWR